MGLLDDKAVREGIGIFSEITGLMALPVVVGALAGRWLDQKYDTDPWFIIIGTALGVLLASISIAKLVKKYIKNNN